MLPLVPLPPNKNIVVAFTITSLLIEQYLLLLLLLIHLLSEFYSLLDLKYFNILV